VEKQLNKTYNMSMDILDKFIRADETRFTGQSISDLINGVYEEYEYFKTSKAQPEVVIYYRDLLTYLVKTYGH
jgi:hypothetical protein